MMIIYSLAIYYDHRIFEYYIQFAFKGLIAYRMPMIPVPNEYFSCQFVRSIEIHSPVNLCPNILINNLLNVPKDFNGKEICKISKQH